MLTPKSDQQMAITPLGKVFMTSWEHAPLEPSHNIQNSNHNDHAFPKIESFMAVTHFNCKFTSEIFFTINSKSLIRTDSFFFTVLVRPSYIFQNKKTTAQHLFSVTIVASSSSPPIVVTAISGMDIVVSELAWSGPCGAGSAAGVEPISRGEGDGEMGFGITLIGTAGDGGTVSGAVICTNGVSIVILGCVSSMFSGVVRLGPVEFDFDGPVEFDPLVKLVLCVTDCVSLNPPTDSLIFVL